MKRMSNVTAKRIPDGKLCYEASYAGSINNFTRCPRWKQIPFNRHGTSTAGFHSYDALIYVKGLPDQLDEPVAIGWSLCVVQKILLAEVFVSSIYSKVQRPAFQNYLINRSNSKENRWLCWKMCENVQKPSLNELHFCIVIKVFQSALFFLCRIVKHSIADFISDQVQRHLWSVGYLCRLGLSKIIHSSKECVDVVLI